MVNSKIISIISKEQPNLWMLKRKTIFLHVKTKVESIFHFYHSLITDNIVNNVMEALFYVIMNSFHE